ncbi:MAG: hypothetical protein OXP69_17510 [Spirochaetaceae bacterium]|nr:hypothetical protein [Spirochaetaceae bacterium]MDE0336206.1 hypothetical protein [Caldilineaceae bacterium]
MSSRKCASLGTSLMHSGRTPTMRAARMCALWLVAHVHGGAFRVPRRFVRRNEGVHTLAAEPPLVSRPPAPTG